VKTTISELTRHIVPARVIIYQSPMQNSRSLLPISQMYSACQRRTLDRRLIIYM